MSEFPEIIDKFKYKFYVTNSNMSQLISQLREEKRVEDLCQQKSLNTDLLKDLFKLKMRGFNNTQVAQKLGVHRVTIQRYAEILRKVTESEFEIIYNFVNKSQKEMKDGTTN